LDVVNFDRVISLLENISPICCYKLHDILQLIYNTDLTDDKVILLCYLGEMKIFILYLTVIPLLEHTLYYKVILLFYMCTHDL